MVVATTAATAATPPRTPEPAQPAMPKGPAMKIGQLIAVPNDKIDYPGAEGYTVARITNITHGFSHWRMDDVTLVHLQPVDGIPINVLIEDLAGAVTLPARLGQGLVEAMAAAGEGGGR
jgi:hypothetical protein